MRKIIIIASICLAVIALGVFLLGKGMSNQEINSTFPQVSDVENRPSENVDVFRTRSGVSFPALTFINDPLTEQLADDFYVLTEDKETYDIFYDQTGGSITIMLYKKPLSFTRIFAEKRLREVLPFTEDELCQMEVAVVTNGFVDPGYTGTNLGLSFCEGSTNLN